MFFPLRSIVVHLVWLIPVWHMLPVKQMIPHVSAIKALNIFLFNDVSLASSSDSAHAIVARGFTPASKIIFAIV